MHTTGTRMYFIRQGYLAPIGYDLSALTDASIVNDVNVARVAIDVQLDEPLRLSGSVYGLLFDPNHCTVRTWESIGPGVPIDVYLNRVRYWPVDPSASVDDLRRIVGELEATFARLACCYSGVEWDGANNVGTWGDALEPLCGEVEQALADVATVRDPFDDVAEHCTIGDWLNAAGVVSLDAALEEWISDSEAVYNPGPLKDALLEWLKQWVEEAEEQGEDLDADDAARLPSARAILNGTAPL